MLRRGQPQNDAASARLNETWLAQPALFVVEYALARLWMSLGVRPQAMIGYSLGEYVAACLAGVLSLEDALALVAKRARMIQDLEAGAMLAVTLPEAELAPRLVAHGLSLAAVNGPNVCVAAGPVAAVEALERELAEASVVTRRLPTTHAFHSAMMERLAGPLTELVRTFKLKAPEVPYVSNVTGAWITPEQAADPEYWARHMVQPVRFADGAAELLRERGRILLEVGPGLGLSSFVKQHPGCDAETASLTFPSMRAGYGKQADLELLLGTLGRLWLAGVPVDWQAFWAGETRRRVPLPTYPFERQRYWVDPVLDGAAAPTAARRVTLDKQPDMADWFYRPVWKPAPLPEGTHPEGGWLVFCDPEGLGDALAERLRGAVRVLPGAAFAEVGPNTYEIDPARPGDYDALLAAVGKRLTAGVVHLWSAAPVGADEPFERIQDRGFYSLLFLAQALGKRGLTAPVRIEVVTSQVQRVTGGEALVPEKATLIGPCRVIPQEFPRLTCRAIDVEPSMTADRLLAELAVDGDEPMIAWRDGERFVQSFEREPLSEVPGTPARLRERGVYLITGGLGGLGLTVAGYLARTVQARLVLTGRSPFPPREEWDGWLAAHGEAGDPVSARIHQLLEIEEAGGEVLAVSADAADLGSMRAVIDQARSRFGALHGVIHMAGTPGGGIIQLKTREAAARIMAPKVEGARVLDALFPSPPDPLSQPPSQAPGRGGEESEALELNDSQLPSPGGQGGRLGEGLGVRALDFLVVFSSIASVLGEFGQADYCGANAFLDAFAQRNAARGGVPTVTIDWDIWREVGLAVHTEVPAHLKAWRQEMLEQALWPQEGVEALGRVLDRALGRVPQVVVSAQELPGRIELGKSFTGESFLAELEKAHFPGQQGQPARRVLGTAHAAAADGSLERRVAEVWQRVLGVDEIGLNDNFFDLGGNSLLGLQLVSELSRDLEVQIAPVTLFESPTVSALTRHIRPEPEVTDRGETDELAERRRRLRQSGGRPPIAIVGMAGRFPGARDVDELWRNLRGGVESVTFFSDEELLASGVSPEVFNDPRYVRAGAILEDIELFDAGLFGYSPREAEVMDPQHRIFLEQAWEVLEKAGYDPSTYPGAIGVFAGSNLSTYLLRLYGDPDVKASVNMLQAILGNDKDSLTTTVSYKLNLRGPSVAVQTFCSTSLVAVHMACQSLRNGECDMALAGGIRVVTPERQGYMYEQGGIAPSDGHSRSFDAKANGSVLGHGVGIVCLKRLDDALADGDPIQAVILGSAINNDGSLKAGYTAPSVAGQAEAIAAAYEDAGVDPETLSYVEAHGSATELGDPIELAALTKAFRTRTDKRQYCPIGSVKANFGHLDRAAGVTGLIKTVLSLRNGEIPPNVLFDEPNPKIDFEGSPFFVNTELRPWASNGAPRRAAVNSLGMGGTNVHVIVEEAPRVEPSGPSRPWQLLLLSARTDTALDTATGNLADFLEAHPETTLADAAFTLQVGRTALEHRRTVVCRDGEDAVAVLRGGDPRRVMTAYREEGERPVVFLFSGLGGQYPAMGRGLYETEPAFRAEVDRCAEVLQPILGVDIREVMYPVSQEDAKGAEVDLRKMLRRQPQEDPATARLNETRFAHPALFVLEYALAKLWMEWGIRPQAMIGYSLGEYVAACLAGVFSLEDALALVAERARLIEELPAGAMLAVGLPEDEAAALLDGELSVAAVNGPEQTVIAGPLAAVESLEKDLAARGIACRRLQASHAFHSRMMAPLFEEWAERVGQATLRAPRIPYISNVTGTWITAGEATDPSFWAQHTCQTVRFSEGVAELLREPGRVLLEIGPGPTLGSLVLQHPAGREAVVVGSLRHSYETQPDAAYALTALGRLWLTGVRVDWGGFYARERRLRVVLPTYPFERRRYWIDTVDGTQPGRRLPAGEEGTYLYIPAWRRSPLAAASAPSGRWLVFADGEGIGDALTERLRGAGLTVSVVRPGAAGEPFTALGEGTFRFDPRSAEGHAALLDALGGVPDRVVHLWTLGVTDGREALALGFESLLAFAGALVGRGTAEPVRLWVVGDELHDVTGDETLLPEKAAALGACHAIPAELPHVSCRAVDVTLPENGLRRERLLGQLLAELGAETNDRLVALRGPHRWAAAVEPVPASPGESTVHVIEPGKPLAEAAEDLRSLTAEPSGGLLVVAEAPGAEAAALGFLAGAFAAGSDGRWTSVVWGLGAPEPEAVSRLLGSGAAPQAVASPLPLPERWSRLEPLPEGGRAARTTRTAVGFYPRPTLRVEYVAPRNETEERIARLWQELLGVAQVGVHDNFLDLGGDSLLATRLAARMRETFHLDLPVRIFFEKSTVAELGEAVDALRHEEQERQTLEMLDRIKDLSEEELEMEILRMESLAEQGGVARG
ncbi:MAG TPA: acyltransferase domain-containing protein [Thermoanaerobaculia bacterium]|nr:acyltransferase domain-containing protein [Thermoanaerobaculia bacterium]